MREGCDYSLNSNKNKNILSVCYTQNIKKTEELGFYCIL